jgi:hypothetical protein
VIEKPPPNHTVPRRVYSTPGWRSIPLREVPAITGINPMTHRSQAIGMPAMVDMKFAHKECRYEAAKLRCK